MADSKNDSGENAVTTKPSGRNDVANGSLEMEKLSLLNKRAEITLKKRQHEVELSRLSLSVQGQRVSSVRYAQVCAAQSKCKKAIFEIEQQLAPIHCRLREISSLEHLARLEKSVDAERLAIESQKHPKPASNEDAMIAVALGLIDLRDQYQKFAADQTRIASMKTMAADFVRRLTPLIDLASGKTEVPNV